MQASRRLAALEYRVTGLADRAARARLGVLGLVEAIATEAQTPADGDQTVFIPTVVAVSGCWSGSLASGSPAVAGAAVLAVDVGTNSPTLGQALASATTNTDGNAALAVPVGPNGGSSVVFEVRFRGYKVGRSPTTAFTKANLASPPTIAVSLVPQVGFNDPPTLAIDPPGGGGSVAWIYATGGGVRPALAYGSRGSGYGSPPGVAFSGDDSGLVGHSILGTGTGPGGNGVPAGQVAAILYDRPAWIWGPSSFEGSIPYEGTITDSGNANSDAGGGGSYPLVNGSTVGQPAYAIIPTAAPILNVAVQGGAVQSITPNALGNFGYASVPSVQIYIPDGDYTGVSPASAHAVIQSDGSLAVVVDAAGSGYGQIRANGQPAQTLAKLSAPPDRAEPMLQTGNGLYRATSFNRGPFTATYQTQAAGNIYSGGPVTFTSLGG